MSSDPGPASPSQTAANRALTGAAVGTTAGAAAGAAIGAAAGNAGAGAAIGAGSGLALGTVTGVSSGRYAGATPQHVYDASYIQCMAVAEAIGTAGGMGAGIPTAVGAADTTADGG